MKRFVDDTHAAATELANDAERARQLAEAGKRVGWLTFAGRKVDLPGVATFALPADPVGYAAELYAALHTLDAAGLDVIVVNRPPDPESWMAVRDRLGRAAGNDSRR